MIRKKPKSTKSISKYPLIPTREQAVDKAINFIKTCPYKGTAIKIELEAFLGRTNDPMSCSMCQSHGEYRCSCEGIVDCNLCNNRGYVTCPDCEGKPLVVNNIVRDERYCQKFILEHVSKAARDVLVFSKTYWDRTVDTEFTFTLPIDQARYAVEFIKSFAMLGEDIGNKIVTNGAGMHIAILNDPLGRYGIGDGNKLDSRRAKNFAKSMTRMLPALYFLASPNSRSRRLNHRKPQVSLDDKYGAISGSHHVFEYRVFETCYDRPEAILDNICVIANTLKYYTYRQIRHSFFGRIGKVGFDDESTGLDRFYSTGNNYRALMAGVKILKPSYKTISELRKERNFHITLAKIRNKELIKESLWSKEFNHERKNIKELKEEYKLKYKELSADPRFKATYPTSVKYINELLPELKVLKQSKGEFINEKKLIDLERVSAVINV